MKKKVKKTTTKKNSKYSITYASTYMRIDDMKIERERERENGITNMPKLEDNKCHPLSLFVHFFWHNITEFTFRIVRLKFCAFVFFRFFFTIGKKRT